MFIPRRWSLLVISAEASKVIDYIANNSNIMVQNHHFIEILKGIMINERTGDQTFNNRLKRGGRWQF